MNDPGKVDLLRDVAMRSTATTSKPSWRPLATNASSSRLVDLIRGALWFVGRGGA